MLVKRRWPARYFCWMLALTVSVGTLLSCQSNSDTALSDPILAQGQQLAKKHCSNCHQLPAPDLLDKKTWVKHILPAMAPNLGMDVYQDSLYYAGARAVLSFDDWQKLVDYYRTLAPDELNAAPAPTPLVNDWAIFSLQMPQRDTTRIAMTTLVAVDTLSHQLYSSDALSSGLYRWDQTLRPTLFRQLASAAAHAAFFRDAQGNEQGLFTCMGTMQAADIARGELVELALTNDRRANPTVVSTGLPRPVQSVAADMDKDGLTDWVVCGFGHNSGGLYWLKQRPNHKFTKLPIREVAGASQVITGDFNTDGWPDLMVLFAHADEGIWLFLNNTKGGFSARNLLRFPSVYGSTSFQLVDFNADGRLDILYTCGDNSDLSKILKPYHGVYLYLNQGNFTYKQTYFYPINGCTKAVATDFDQDGDLDIMTIAFFANFRDNPAEGCIYFEQQKPGQFRPHALPVSQYGRWICMDVNDWDQDGDQDVILGNFSRGFINQAGSKSTWDTHISLIVLKNKVRKSSVEPDSRAVN